MIANTEKTLLRIAVHFSRFAVPLPYVAIEAGSVTIKTVRQRQDLKPRREPYWHPIATGQHLGYRRAEAGGSWIARAYDPATRKRLYKALPESGSLPGSMQFDDASRRAREWFEHLGKGGMAETITVWQACERYVEHIRREKGEQAADDAEHRLQRDVQRQPMAKIQLTKLAPRHVKEWREYMRTRPAKSPRRGKAFEDHPDSGAEKTDSTVNRDIVPLRAALNLAKADGFVTSDFAWSRPLAPVKGAGGRRHLYLEREQRLALIDNIEVPELVPFVRALCMLPLRPGPLAPARVGDFDSRRQMLTIKTDKAGGGRSLLLPPAAVELLSTQSTDKLPAAYLFARPGGEPWNKDAWKKPIKAAAEQADLPPETTLYTVRHSVITDLVTQGLDIFTVAQLAGTSVRMIEQHYGHLRQEHARDALARLMI